MKKILIVEDDTSILGILTVGLQAAGYEASFIVLGGDPIANFEAVKNIKLRFKQGNFILQQ